MDEPPTEASSGMAVLKHPRASRWMHWINFPLLFIMIWSGLRIYWANDVYRIGWGDWTLFEFFPDWVYDKLQLNRKLAKGIAFHMAFAWLFAINGVLFGVYLAVSGHWRRIWPERGWLRDCLRTVAHDLHLTKETPPSQSFYNAAQRVTYTVVILLGGLALLTGFSIFKPTQLSLLTTLLGGYETARAIHFWVTISFLVFFAVHLLQVARSGWRNFSSMITGYELQDSAPVSAADDGAQMSEEESADV
ncbi:MAG: cytochrome b/b6 domain-containing protein [Actinomycetota bacterium]|nr:cytochrome b/b6 domain-containing protein [Actinomycetota bacterium]